MRIFPISDLHLERRRLDLIAPPTEPFDLLACPGDLYEGHPEHGLAALLHLAQGRPITARPTDNRKVERSNQKKRHRHGHNDFGAITPAAPEVKLRSRFCLTPALVGRLIRSHQRAHPSGFPSNLARPRANFVSDAN